MGNGAAYVNDINYAPDKFAESEIGPKPDKRGDLFNSIKTEIEELMGDLTYGLASGVGNSKNARQEIAELFEEVIPAYVVAVLAESFNGKNMLDFALTLSKEITAASIDVLLLDHDLWHIFFPTKLSIEELKDNVPQEQYEQLQEIAKSAYPQNSDLQSTALATLLAVVEIDRRRRRGAQITATLARL